MNVVALVPAKDRQDSVAATVTALSRIGSIDRVLVVDDGSDDATAARALEAGADVLELGRNRGKAGAIAAGVEATPEAEIYLLIDADVGDDASLAGALLEPVLSDEVDLTIGVLPAAGSRGGFGLVRRASAWGVKRGCGLELRAPLSGQRAVRAEYLRALGASRRFGLEVAMTIDAVRAGARVREVDVEMGHRFTGRSVAGFGHRAKQGIDIATSLWPRLVPRLIERGLVVAVVMGLLAVSFVASRSTTSAGVAPARHVDHVVVIGIPHLGLDDLGSGTLPNLDRLARQGALGAMAVRTVGSTRSASVYATLGAGYPVAAADADSAAAQRDESIEGTPAIDVVERRTGKRPSGEVLVPSMPSILRSAGSRADTKPGALGDALTADGIATAVVANSNTFDTFNRVVRSAPAALAVTSSLGAIDRGEVSEGLLRPDSTAPFGVVASDEAFVTAFEGVAARSGVVVVDPGETDRAAAFRSQMLDKPAAAAMAAAKDRTDKLIGAIERHLAPNTLLIVAGMSPPTPRPEIVPVVFWGAGVPSGTLESPSTNTNGLITLTDLAPTIISALGKTAPAAMIGQPVRYRAGSQNLSSLRSLNDLTMARNRSYGGFQSIFIDLVILLYLVAAISILWREKSDRVRASLRFCFVAMATVPLMTFVARWMAAYLPVEGLVTPISIGLALVCAWVLCRFLTSDHGALHVVCALGVALIVVDLATGANLQLSSLLGYTPTAAARFSGIGNAAFAVLAASAVLTITWIMERSERPRRAWWVAAGLVVVVVVADGAPWLGADVGGILSLVPALGILLWMLSGRRLNWKSIGIAGALGALVLGAVVAYEAFQEPSARDHIGRFFLGGAGGGTFWTTIGRKVSTNIRLLFASPWSQLIPLTAGFVAIVYLFDGRWSTYFPPRSIRRIGLIGGLLVALLGYATNDSGAMAAAIMSTYLGSYVALAALATPDPEPRLVRPGERTMVGS